MEESVYATLSDPYFAVLCDSRANKDAEAAKLDVESYAQLLTRLEHQYNARIADISATESETQEINDKIKNLQTEVAHQREIIDKQNAAQKRYEHFQTILTNKFAKPVELMVNFDREEDDEMLDSAPVSRNRKSRRIVTTLDESAEQLESKQEMLLQQITEVETEMEQDLIDFHDRLQDLNHIYALLSDFDRKYGSPRGSLKPLKNHDLLEMEESQKHKNDKTSPENVAAHPKDLVNDAEVVNTNNDDDDKMGSNEDVGVYEDDFPTKSVKNEPLNDDESVSSDYSPHPSAMVP